MTNDTSAYYGRNVPDKTRPLEPWKSARSDLRAQNVVATSQPLAAQAGLELLRDGGNAVDAALASAITLTVVEPTMNGIGSDAFAIVADKDGLQGFNGSGRSPAAWTSDRFAGHQQMPGSGPDSVTVPGAVDAWVQLSDRFGQVPFARLFDRAIGYARSGYPVSPIVASTWRLAASLHAERDVFRSTFMPGGRTPESGEIFRAPEMADTLSEIASTRGTSFYQGQLAKKTAEEIQKLGGAMTTEDLAAHRGEWVDCLSQDFGDVVVHEIPPNGQGIAALMAFGILNHLDLASYPADSAESLHLQIEAMKFSFAEVHAHVADPPHMRVDVARLLDPAHHKWCAQQIRLDRAAFPKATIRPDHGTVYLTTADSAGMMVSLIQSNYFGFGSGVVVPGTGISLQNRGSGFSLVRDHPNEVGGSKRPYHTIVPAFVTRSGAPLMSFGVMGGHHQPQGHVQVMSRIFLYGFSPQQALDAPRWHLNEDFSVCLEEPLDPMAVELGSRGQRIKRSPGSFLFGGGQVILREEHGYCAGSDPRKDGQAVGF